MFFGHFFGLLVHRKIAEANNFLQFSSMLDAVRRYSMMRTFLEWLIVSLIPINLVLIIAVYPEIGPSESIE